MMKTALRQGDSQPSLHYVSTSTGGGVTTTIVGDVNQTAGMQTILLSRGKTKARIVIELVGHEAYFRGSAAAVESAIGLTVPESAAAAGQWISVVPSDSVYQSTAAALTVRSVISEMALAPPITGGRKTVVGGRTVIQMSGSWVGNGITQKEHATANLYIAGLVTPLPIRFSGVAPPTATSSRFVDSMVLSRWGEPVHVVAPASSVPLATITQPTTVV